MPMIIIIEKVKMPRAILRCGIVAPDTSTVAKSRICKVLSSLEIIATAVFALKPAGAAAQMACPDKEPIRLQGS